MEIIERKDEYSLVRINDADNFSVINYNFKERDFYFIINKIDCLVICKNQLLKILNSKSKNSFFEGFGLNFVLDKDYIDYKQYFNDRLLVVDRRGDEEKIYTLKKETDSIKTIFTDACCLTEKQSAAWAIIIRGKKQLLSMHYNKLRTRSNNLIELLAVIEGIKLVDSSEKIRLVCDSQYVIKGIFSWVPVWKLNNWITANGVKAKNIEYWKELDYLLNNRYIEFQWVKGHRDNFENGLCDYYARLVAER